MKAYQKGGSSLAGLSFNICPPLDESCMLGSISEIVRVDLPATGVEAVGREEMKVGGLVWRGGMFSGDCLHLYFKG